MIIKGLRLVSDTVAGQVISLLVLAIILLHTALTLFFLWDDAHGTMPLSPAEIDGQVAALVHLYVAAPPEERAHLLDQINDVVPAIASASGPLPADATPIDGYPLQRVLGPDIRLYGVNAPAGVKPARHMIAALPDGSLLTIDFPHGLREPFLGPTTITLGFLVIATTFVVGWAIIVITGPLRRFVSVIEGIRDLQSGADIREDGPREIRAAIAAFNRMRGRIGKLMGEKTQMLAAVSHDLRTPITRLRLRAEFIEDDSIREPMLADLDHMAALVQAALTHLSGASSTEPFARADLPSLLQTIADQFADCGYAVSYEGPEKLPAKVRLRDLQRAVTNLVDNGIRHGTVVTIRLEAPRAGEVNIVVEDNGPGIPAEQRARLMEPFERGDSARTSASNTGFGLGLTIARDVCHAHGGELILGDATPQGLMATMRLRPVTGSK
ncbi:ATP-binding protein [Oryzibacter oryziterrae]|uniref:ATP-binding protein n=1 Tax=Oryzibacter oryziterrae TaxID=2766474 RepID=UPI001F388042|nr:ATP-binding protein [Oryzibacter oryziterrae]